MSVRLRRAFPLAVLVLTGSAALRAEHAVVVLPGGAEVCLNGARFAGRETDVGAGLAFISHAYDGATQIGTGNGHIFADDEYFRFEVRYPGTTFAAGETVTLSLDNGAGLFDSRTFTVQDCSFIENGDFTTNAAGWSLTGAAEQLNSGEFPHGDADPVGDFLLLTTNHASSPVAAGDLDFNGVADFDRAAATQTYHPLHPCSISLVIGFYSEEVGGDAVDDFVRLRFVDGGIPSGIGFSVPGVAGSDLSNWPYGFDGVARTVVSGGAANGSSFVGGGAAPFSVSNFGGEGGQDVTVTFDVLDQLDGLFDTGLLVDRVRCVSRLIFGSNFENGSFLEWDDAIGVPI